MNEEITPSHDAATVPVAERLSLRVCPNIEVGITCAAFVHHAAVDQWLRPTSHTLCIPPAFMNPTLPYDVEKGVGGSEANDKSIRPGLPEMTSNTSTLGPEGSHSGKASTQAGEGGVPPDAKPSEKQEAEPVLGVYIFHGRGLHEV